MSADFPPLTAPLKRNADIKDSPVPPIFSGGEAENHSMPTASHPPPPKDIARPAETDKSPKESPPREIARAEETKSPLKSGLRSKQTSQKSEAAGTTGEVQSAPQPPKNAGVSTTAAAAAGSKVVKPSPVKAKTKPKTPADLKNMAHKFTLPIQQLPQNSFERSISSSAAVDSSRPSSSGTNSSQATLPASRNPRTLRLVPPAKIDVSKKIVTPPPESTAFTSVASKRSLQQEKQAPAKQPSTPVNDLISDNASLTSASLSRPPSPFGGKPGTGPASQKSRNQVKKDRQARAKQVEEAKLAEESTSSPVQEEIVQAPIIGRKKKSKKPQATLGIVTGADSEVSSPQVEDRAAMEKRDQETKEAITMAKEMAVSKRSRARVVEESGTENTTPVESISVQPRAGMTPAAIFPDLKKAGVISSTTLDLFLGPSGVNTRFETAIASNFAYDDFVHLTSQEKKLLDQGECIPKRVYLQEYAVVLPDRSVLRHLSHEEAKRYIELRKEFIHATAGCFTSPAYPADAWLNFTSNDLLSGHQVAPPLDSNDDEAADAGTPEALLKEYAASIMRPDSKEPQYATMYPPRTQSENDEIEARMAMMTVEEAEQTLKASEELLLSTRKEAEVAEKKLNQVLKKNRKILRDWL